MRTKVAVQPTPLKPDQAPTLPPSEPSLPVSILTRSIVTEANDKTLQVAEIRELAFRLYEERGRADGHEVEDWLEAEAILRNQGKQAAA